MVGPVFSIPEPGDLVADKYIVVRHLAKGAMGLVAEARHTKLEQRVALKFMLPRELERPESLRRFAREARAASRIKSPFAVRVLDVDQTNEGLPFIVMEYLEGRDVGSELKDRGTIPVAEAVDWLLQACTAVAEAHARGIIHRDLKPANLFLAATDDGATILKVTDFGVAKFVSSEDSDLTSTGAILGTPHYMAPEQLLNGSKGKVDQRIDVWALGVVLYRLVTGKLPISGDSPTAIAIAVATTPPTPLASVAPHLPAALCEAVMKAVCRALPKRWPDVGSFARAIEPFGTGKVAFVAPVLPPPGSSGASVQAQAMAAEEAEGDTTKPIAMGSEPTVVEGAPDVEHVPAEATNATSGRKSPRFAGALALTLGGVTLAVVLLFRFVSTSPRLADASPAPIERSTSTPSVSPQPTAPALSPSPPPSGSSGSPSATPSASTTEGPKPPGPAPAAAPALPSHSAAVAPSRPARPTRPPMPDASITEDPLHL